MLKSGVFIVLDCTGWYKELYDIFPTQDTIGVSENCAGIVSSVSSSQALCFFPSKQLFLNIWTFEEFSLVAKLKSLAQTTLATRD